LIPVAHGAPTAACKAVSTGQISRVGGLFVRSEGARYPLLVSACCRGLFRQRRPRADSPICQTSYSADRDESDVSAAMAAFPEIAVSLGILGLESLRLLELQYEVIDRTRRLLR